MRTTRNAVMIAIVGSLLLSTAALCLAQSHTPESANRQLTTKEFQVLAQRCAPEIPLITLRAIARAESAFRPYALSLNYPKRTAREHGLQDGGILLARQPRTLPEARAWTHYLLGTGRSVSIGLFQINSEHAGRLGLTTDQLFDPCTNIKAGARLLKAYYRQAAAVVGEGQQALQYALSGYNSGFPLVGFTNGYVDSVVQGEVAASRHGVGPRESSK
jgi:type IV secretion system protein VirB1